MVTFGVQDGHGRAVGQGGVAICANTVVVPLRWVPMRQGGSTWQTPSKRCRATTTRRVVPTRRAHWYEKACGPTAVTESDAAPVGQDVVLAGGEVIREAKVGLAIHVSYL